MRRHAPCIALTIAAAVGLATPASAAIFVFGSSFSPEAPGATGTGLVRVTYDSELHTLGIQADWSGLSGTTTVAHIHCCVAAPGTVGVAVTPGTLPLFPVGVSAGSYSVLLDLTQAATYTAAFRNNFGGGTAAGAEAALFQGMQNERAYFNIHTDLFPAGEIRGFLAPVPEPASWALLVLGFGVLGGVMRQRSPVHYRPAVA